MENLHSAGGSDSLDGNGGGENIGFKDFVDLLIESGEGLDSFYWDSAADPQNISVGYGYNIFAQQALYQKDFASAGIDLSSTQIADIDTINNSIAAGDISDAYSLYSSDFTGNNVLPQINQGEAADLLDDVRVRDLNSLQYLSNDSLANTRELAVLEDLYYNGQYNLVSEGDNLVADIADGNRADAWYEIRYDSNAGWQTNNSTTKNAADRRDLESQVFDLYSSDVDPNGTGTPDFSLVTMFTAAAEIDQIFQMYTVYQEPSQNPNGPPGIIAYDHDYGPSGQYEDAAANANTNYSSFLNSPSGGDGLTIQSTDAAFMPAFDYLSSHFAEGVYVPGDFSSLVEHQTDSGVDQFNVYVDPASSVFPSQGKDAIVSFTPTYAEENYILMGYGLFQTLQGHQGIKNVIISPDGGDTIDPGSASDVVWGAPSETDQNGDTLPGSVLDLSGTDQGLAQSLFGSTIRLSFTQDSNDNAELDVISGSNTLKTFYITTIVGGNGLSILDLPGSKESIGQTINFVPGSDGVTTIIGSDGWTIAVEGFTEYVLGNGDQYAEIGVGFYEGGDDAPPGQSASSSSNGQSNSNGGSGTTGIAEGNGTNLFTIAPSSSGSGSDSGSGGTSGSSGSSGGSDPDTFTLVANSGNDTVESDADNVTVEFGTGNDTLTNAGPGSVIEAGTGTDTFDLSNDVEIVGAEAQDVLEWAGQMLHGATEWASAQGGWAVNALTDVEYGIDTLGELEVKNILGQVMTLTDYTGGPGAAYDTAGIYLAVLSMAAYRLLDPNKPNVDFIESQLSLANAEYKADTGKPLFQGMDPLVLDLTGAGLQLIGESEQSPLFDAYGDGFAVHTGWVKPADGLLVWDNNGTYELFGAPGSSGFAALATKDSNDDGVINAQDSIFSQLYVWQDLNGNGVIDPGELTSLTELGIASINTSGMAQTADIVNGNYVTATGTFTYTNGSTSTIGDVSFATDNFHTQYTGNTTVSTAAAALPNLKGYGTLTDLQVAMTIDPALITTVMNTLSSPSMDVVNLDTLRNTAMTIFTAWAAAVPLSDTALAPGGHSDVPILLTTNGSQVTVTDYAYEVTNANGTYWVLASGHQVLDASGNVIPYPTLAQIYAQTSSTGSWTTITGAELDFAERYLGDGITINDNPADASQTLSVLGPELTAAWNALNLETVRLAMQQA